MSNNLRENITRTITYSIVTITAHGVNLIKTVYGKTTQAKEMKKILRTDTNEIPQITVKVVTERRTMSLDNFLNNSIIINESEEN